MATGNPYSRMISKMRTAGQYYNGYELELGTVTSVSPLQIAYKNVAVKRVFSQNPVDPERKYFQVIQNEENISEELRTYLKELYQTLYLQTGDTVFVQRVGDSFFIVGKAV